MAIYNQISGSNISSDLRLLFKEFENENFYLAFSRADETWGTCALINISLPPESSITDILAYQDEQSLWITENKFVDKNIGIYDVTPALAQVRIYKTLGTVSDFNSDLTNYSSITNQELVEADLELLYINNDWCVIKGLPANYQEYLNNSDGSKFYIMTAQPESTYPSHPTTGSGMVKINVRNTFDSYSLNEGVKLVLSSPPDLEHVSRFDTTLINSLTKNTTNLGEVYVKGLTNQSFFDDTGYTEAQFLSQVNSTLGYLSYINESLNDSTGYYFYLINENDIRVSDNLFLQKNILANSVFQYDAYGHKYLLFKSKKSACGNDTESYLKVSYEIPDTGLAIYNEALPYLTSNINSVSDANPPALEYSYLKKQTVDSSIFDVKGLIQLKKDFNATNGSPLVLSSKISYVKQMRDIVEKNKFISEYGFNTTSKRIDTVPINSSTVLKRTGNIRPKPNGLPYLSTDRRLYLWTNNFILNDQVRFKLNPTDETYFPVDGSYLTVTTINYDEGYIGFSANLGTGNIVPSESDSITNPQVESADTNIMALVDFAVCDTYDDAMRFGMDSVMVTLNIPTSIASENIYDELYRQLAICHKPKWYDTVAKTESECTGLFYKELDNVSLFNIDTHSYNIGTLVYLSNKHPINRKFILGRESFKLII